MSCNGCRVLRKGCSPSCVLRPCLEWIESPEAQANATLFVSKFFGRRDLLDFISNVPENKRTGNFEFISAAAAISSFFVVLNLILFFNLVNLSLRMICVRTAVFQSLLFEACGRQVNPVNGAVGLLSTGNWHVCQSAVQTVLAGGTLRPLNAGIFLSPRASILASSEEFSASTWSIQNQANPKPTMHGSRRVTRIPLPDKADLKEYSGRATTFEADGDEQQQKPKLLKLFI